VLPLDDDELLEAARPMRHDGAMGPDPEKLEARHDAPSGRSGARKWVGAGQKKRAHFHRKAKYLHGA
jgi:hypothetical protein